MTLNRGQQIDKGKYTIERELGRGRFGITYLARTADGQKWAIKILNPDVLAKNLDPRDRDRLETMFWQESVKLARCNSPHIVHTTYPFKEGTLICLPMEYIDSNSLADRAKLKMKEETALEYIRQIGEALDIVHQQKLVHCDIRPANIFLRNRDGKTEAVLADFGLARTFDAELSLPRENERIDGFSPLELYHTGEHVGAYTDVYSLAATLYELLTGKVPASVKDRQDKQELISPKQYNSEISEKTTKAILKGLELLPAARPSSVQAWLATLNLVEKKLEEPISPKKTVNWQTNWMAATVFVTLIVGIPVWLTWMGIGPTTKPPVTVSPKP